MKIKWIVADAIEKALMNGFEEARVSNIADFDSCILKYGVSWPSIGAVNNAKAQEFANNVMMASEFAQVINDMNIEKSYRGIIDDTDKNNYREIVKKLEPVVEERKTWLFKETVESIIKEYEIREEQ